MADEAEDLSNEHILEGSEDIMSAIDQELSKGGDQQQSTETQQTTQVTGADDQQQQQATETQAEATERARNEKGQFTAEQKAAADKAAADKATADAGKTTADPKDKEYPAEIKSGAARKHFDTVTAARDAAERRAQTAESKLKQFEAKIQELESKSGVAAPEVKLLQKENADLKAQLEERDRVLSFTAVQETKPFKEGVTIPQKEALDEINSAATLYKLDGRKIDEILNEPDKYKRREMYADLTEEMSDRARTVLGDDLKNNIEKYVAAEAKAKQLFEHAKGNKEFATQQQQEAEAKANLERQTQYESGYTHAEEKLKTTIPELADELATIVSKAKQGAVLSKLSPATLAGDRALAFATIPLLKMLRAERAAHQATKDVMAKRNGASLSPTGGRTATTKSEDEENYDPNRPESGLMGMLDEVLGS